ncbi:transcriptional regulator, ArsR family [Thermosinus carboxydivorans Nor1]|uniref:Transcriptional regulator, ArsR family n=1 Tax=Thermosinus carboxydivorans Nor1 TaxID=401526 RepID=A1HUC1_9FIRM|nr:metalloregulator ArsR/SmtB family transcription factor [Thermosinus carboxydivorans]EAX46378.1 transcriptional regulator, ArsR family [Thermosinus carboxydivorans Nor1]
MKDLAQIFKALGDETRLEIVKMLRGRQLCVCEIMDAFKLSQPAISHHLKILRQAGVIDDAKEGKWVFYSLNPEAFRLIEAFLTQIRRLDEGEARRRPCSPYQIQQEEEEE